MPTRTPDQLLQENEELRRRLEEAEETIRAIRAGEVDAVLVDAGLEQVFTLESADKPYRLLVEQMPQGAATLTPEGAILYCNPRFADLLEQPLSSLPGRSILEFVAHPSRPHVEALLHNARALAVQGEVTLCRADGSPVPVYLGINALQEGALGLCLVVTDLTEQEARKRAERFAERIARLQSVTASLSEAVTVNQVAEVIVTHGLDVLGATVGVVAALSADRTEFVNLRVVGFCPEVAAGWVRFPVDAPLPMADAVRLGRPVVLESRSERQARYPELARTPSEEGDGALVALPLVFHGRAVGALRLSFPTSRTFTADDLAYMQNLAQQCAQALERARLYDAEHRAREAAEHEIRERRRAEEALREADRRKDQFLATLGHELRNPLAPILNALHLMRRHETDNAELRWAQEVLLRQTRQLSRLVDDLLDVSRIASGKVELRLEPVELAAVIQGAAETSQPLISANRHQLSLTLPPEPVRVQGDPARLAQVFANLLNNAAKYMEPGGRIWLTAGCEVPEAVVRVRDEGIGISADMLPRIFDPFAQSARSLARSQGGLGIGLSLVRGLVQLHGGTVEARSDGPGQGSEFVVRLPVLTQSAPAPTAPRPAEARTAGPRLCVLVVDDNVDVAQSLAMLLRADGHEVAMAHDGRAALARAKEDKPDLILLDLGLPEMDGFEVCRLLRGEPEREGIFLAAVTGYAQDEDRERSRQAGFDAHLVKPVEIGELQKLCARAAQRQGAKAGGEGSET